MNSRKVAVVTGAGGYIGSETALRLAKSGYAVAVCDINEVTLKNTVEKIEKQGGECKGYIIDVTDSKSVNEVFDSVKSDFGSVDASIHVAGGSARIAGQNAQYKRLADQEDYVIDAVLKINLYGALYVSRAAARIMREQGTGGRIINFSSIVGTNGLKACVEYAAAKAGVMGMTKALAKEVGEYGVTVNSVAPGIVMRPEEKGDERAYNTNFLKRKCTAVDIANLVNYLASDEAAFITGQVYVIDGGRSLAMKGSD